MPTPESTQRRRRTRRLVIGVLLVLTLTIIWAYWPRARTVDSALVTRGDIRIEIVDEGRTRMHDVYVIAAPAAGRVLRIEVEPGDAVKKNDRVASMVRAAAAPLDARLAAESRAAVTAAAARHRAAVAAAELATRELRRIQRLSESKLIAEAAREEADARARAAIAAADAAAADLARARTALVVDAAEPETGRDTLAIRTPAAGRVLRLSQQSESIVAAGAPLLTIGDPDSIEVVADFRSEDAVRMRAGMAAVIDAWGGAPLPARVERIEPAAYTKISALGIEEQRTKVLLQFVQSPPAALRAQDYRVDARVTVDSRRNIVRVPQSALFRSGEKWRAFRIDRGRARSVEVSVGIGDGHEREVLQGLSLGDRVVLYPRPDLTDGARVR